MIKKMNLVRPALFAALLCGVSAASSLAQDPAATPNPSAPGPLITPPPLLPFASPPPPPPRMQPMDRQGPPRSNPLFDALDTNHDGVISAEEIANASASLKTLLKNGSDHLTREDLRPSGPPPRPPGAAAPGNPAAGEASQERPKAGAIRPHNPPPRWDEGPASEPEGGTRMHPPAPRDEQAREDFDRPHRREEGMREQRRPFQTEDDEMDDNFRPHHPHERLSEHQRPPRPEDDEMGDEPRPHHPEMSRENQGTRPRAALRPDNAGQEGGPGAPQGLHHGPPPPMPLFDALDTNHDGVISAEEIANASAALKGLLKNGSDHLTREDLRPTGPPQGGR